MMRRGMGGDVVVGLDEVVGVGVTHCGCPSL